MTTGMHILASTVYLAVYAMLLYFAVRYLFAGTYLPRHAEAVGHSWTSLNSSAQAVILAMSRVVGAGMLTTAVTGGLITLGAAVTDLTWMKYLAPAPAIVFCGPTLHASYVLRRSAGVGVFMAPSLIGLIGAVLGFIIWRL
jgi:hypothetical protein